MAGVMLLVLVGMLVFASMTLLAGSVDELRLGEADVSVMASRGAPLGSRPPLPPLREYPVEEVVETWAGWGVRLYLPGWVPEGYELRALAHRKCIGHLLFFVYSRTGDFTVASGEIVIELSLFTTGIRDIREVWGENPKVGYYTEINGWQAFIAPSIPMGYPEFTEKYGTPNGILINVVVEGVLYSFTFAPTITLQEAINMVASMQPATK